MQSARTPETCPFCGSDHMARILWGWFRLKPEQMGEVEAGRVILGRRRRDTARARRGTAADPQHTLDAPQWTYLNCQPAWAEVHHMAMEEYELDLAKWKAVEAHDFEVAAAYLNQQDEIDDRITELVLRLKDR
jgi:hypothetical protein